MNVWKSRVDNKNTKFINTLGEIRWWSKHKSLKKVFGSYNNSENSLFVEICQTLITISESENMDADTRYSAKSYLQTFLTFHTTMTAKLFLLIFKSTILLSNY